MMQTNTTNVSIEKIKEESNSLQGLSAEVGKDIVGQHDVIKFIVTSFV